VSFHSLFCFCIYVAREVVIQLLGNSSVGGYRHSYATVFIYRLGSTLYLFLYVMREEGAMHGNRAKSKVPFFYLIQDRFEDAGNAVGMR